MGDKASSSGRDSVRRRANLLRPEMGPETGGFGSSIKAIKANLVGFGGWRLNTESTETGIGEGMTG